MRPKGGVKGEGEEIVLSFFLRRRTFNLHDRDRVGACREFRREPKSAPASRLLIYRGLHRRASLLH